MNDENTPGIQSEGRPVEDSKEVAGEQSKPRIRERSAEAEERKRACTAIWRSKHKAEQKAYGAARYLKEKISDPVKFAEKLKRMHAVAKLKRLSNPEEGKSRSRAYYEKNKAKVLAANKVYRLKTLDKGRQRSKDYRKRNLEKCKKDNIAYKLKNKAINAQKFKDFKAANPEIVRQRKAAFYLRHREKIRAKHAEYYQKNKHIYFRASDARRARKRDAKIGDTRIITQWELSWKKRKKITCYWCREDASTSECHKDHIIPISRGGAHSIENLCVSCSKCNGSKHARNLESWNKSLKEPVLL